MKKFSLSILSPKHLYLKQPSRNIITLPSANNPIFPFSHKSNPCSNNTIIDIPTTHQSTKSKCGKYDPKTPNTSSQIRLKSSAHTRKPWDSCRAGSRCWSEYMGMWRVSLRLLGYGADSIKWERSRWLWPMFWYIGRWLMFLKLPCFGADSIKWERGLT